MKTNRPAEKNRMAAVIFTCLLALLPFATVLGLLNLLGYLKFDSDTINRVNSANYYARNIGSNIEVYADKLSLPEQDEIRITGCRRIDSEFSKEYILANLPSGEKVFLEGNSDAKPTGYWAADIRNVKVETVWYAEHPLTDSELKPYTPDMQRTSMYFQLFPLHRSTVNDSKLVGYWAKGDHDES